MPANRSRTLEWRRCLRQVQERSGALEIAVAPHNPAYDNDGGGSGHDLVWRVRLLGVSDSEIIVEQPSALGQTIQIEQGIELIVVLAIGQNRWMFSTTNLGAVGFEEPSGPPLSLRLPGADEGWRSGQPGASGGGGGREGRADSRRPRSVPGLRLVMPESVQRCQRRSHYRVETAALSLPQVEVWPLLDPKSVLLAERAYEIQFEIDMGRLPAITGAGGDSRGGAPAAFDYEQIMPEVGPKFTAMLVNLGGGGVGLRVGQHESQALGHHKLFWMRIALPPGLSTPICATGKLVHAHMESNHDTYAGMAFDFSFNASHQQFVVEQICRYIALQQKAQLRQSMPNEQRRTA